MLNLLLDGCRTRTRGLELLDRLGAIFVHEIGGEEVEIENFPGHDIKNARDQGTVESLQSGIIYGFAAQVEGIARRMARELSPDDPGAVTTIATGGLAPLVIDEV